MWQLKITKRGGSWEAAGNFDTVTAATQRIVEIEEMPNAGIHLEMYVDPKFGTDEEAFGHLEYTGRQFLYIVKRMVQ